jgi:EAL and modified HD-GYP domain-containing signal transduction protein
MSARGANVVTEVFLARQPILDRQLRVAAYELLYRSGDVEHALVGDEEGHHEGATATVAINALTEIGLERLVGEHQAWLNVSREFVLDGLAMSLPRGRMVLELLEDQCVDERLIASLSELRAAGFALALDDFTYAPTLEPLLGMVDIVKLDLVALGRDGLAREAERLRPYGLTLVGEKVETEADFQFCAQAGCELFQGYFFCKPQLIRGRAVAPNRIALVQLAATLQDPAIELAEL